MTYLVGNRTEFGAQTTGGTGPTPAALYITTENCGLPCHNTDVSSNNITFIDNDFNCFDYCSQAAVVITTTGGAQLQGLHFFGGMMQHGGACLPELKISGHVAASIYNVSLHGVGMEATTKASTGACTGSPGQGPQSHVTAQGVVNLKIDNAFQSSPALSTNFLEVLPPGMNGAVVENVCVEDVASNNTTNVLTDDARGPYVVPVQVHSEYHQVCTGYPTEPPQNNLYSVILQTLQLGSVTYANLGTPVNASFIYCSDCENVQDDSAIAGKPCAPLGHGAFAKHENGRWDCN